MTIAINPKDTTRYAAYEQSGTISAEDPMDKASIEELRELYRRVKE